jgi:hypothetical protein
MKPVTVGMVCVRYSMFPSVADPFGLGFVKPSLVAALVVRWKFVDSQQSSYPKRKITEDPRDGETHQDRDNKNS